MPATAILDVQGLRRRFGSAEAVAGVDLRVAAGETVALLGPNGAGKSTTLAMILGLLSPTAGQVTVGGRTPHQAVDDGLVGALLQAGAGSGLPPGTRVGELVRFVASLYPAPLAPPAVLRHAGLTSLTGRKAGSLSGGELQRVRFALAICADPRLLILDEPTVGLDVPSQRSFWETVRAFAAGGCAVLFATHYLAEAAENAGRVVVLHKGRVAADGTVDEIRRAVAIRRVRFRAPGTDAGALRALPAVQQVRRADSVIILDSTDSDATVRGLVRSGTTFTDLEVTRPIAMAVRDVAAGTDLDAVAQPGQGMALWLHAPDAQDIHDALAAAGTTIVSAPADGPFGRTFTFADPDGYQVTLHDRG